MRQRILIIDSDAVRGLGCQRVLVAAGHEAEYYNDVSSALDAAQAGHFDILLVDLEMPHLTGLEIVEQIKQAGITAEFVVVSPEDSVRSAVDFVKRGAADYLVRPIAPESLPEVVERVCRESAAIRQRSALREHICVCQGFEGILGRSRPMEEVFALIQRVAPTEGTILITGESGTGKEMVARAIHQRSLRRVHPLLACDCSALAPTLLESELFGHVKGSFSGAIATKRGLLEMAHQGTLFLDEVANLSLETQAKLLRVLETKRVRKVGDTAEGEIDIRLIAATNRSLAGMVRAGSFREDLFYRLNVVPLVLPPLHERRGDVPLLAMAFLTEIRKKGDIRATGFMPEAMAQMESYHWPGNVRELRNVVELVAILCDAARIELRHLPPAVRQTTWRSTVLELPTTWSEFRRLKCQLKEAAVRDLECRFLLEALRRSGGNITKAAESVGMLRTNFHALLHKHGMSS